MMALLIGFGAVAGSIAGLVGMFIIGEWLASHAISIFMPLLTIAGISVAWIVGLGIEAGNRDPSIPLYVWIPGLVAVILLVLMIALSPEP